MNIHWPTLWRFALVMVVLGAWFQYAPHPHTPVGWLAVDAIAIVIGVAVMGLTELALWAYRHTRHGV